MPAVLLEAGSIINRDEELVMNSPERQALVGAAVTDAVDGFCAVRRPRQLERERARASTVPKLPLSAGAQSAAPPGSR